jgi:hypothetical protein
MIKTFTAYTGEIDDTEQAVKEIKDRLGIDGVLMKNTVGVIACHYEFVSSGALKAISDALPFDIVGTITSAQAVRDEAGILLLTIMVLTSDDVDFVTKLTPSLLSEPGKVIEKSYAEAAGARTDKPALVLSFAAFLLQNSGDEYVNVLAKASGDVPIFGTLAVDDTLDFANSFMIYNGEHYRDCMALLMIYGDVKPGFFIATMSRNKIFGREALITKSEGHILKEVNDRPVVEYFEDLGLTKASETQYAMSSLPFMLDYKDGTPPVSKVFISLTPEKYAICAGVMPEGSILRIGVFDREDVLLTTEEALQKMLADSQNASALLVYSCISRSMTLGAEQLAELELVREKAGDRLPFMMAYSGGEICPTRVSDEKAINRFHNNAFVICVF